MTIQAEHYTGADNNTYRVWRVGPEDQSPQHLTYPNGYDARCSHCWEGQAHSEAAHQLLTNKRAR